MKSIKILLKIATKNHEKLISERNILYDKLDDLSQKLQDLRNQVKKELDSYFNSEYRSFLENFLKESKKKDSYFLEEISKLNDEIIEMDDKIRESYIEIKRYEIIIQNDKLKKEAEILYQENKELDDIGNIIFLQNKTE